MKPCTITNNALYFSSISEISEEIWEALNCEKNLYFHKDFLLSIEENNSEIRFTYIVLLDTKKTPIAFASLQFVDFYVDDIKNDLEVLVRKIKNVGRKLHLFPKKKPLKILICGNTFVSGEHGVFIEKNQNKKTILKELAKAILHFVNGSPILKKEVNFFLVKDFINESLSISDSLKDYNYSPFLVAPNMLLYLAENWQTFQNSGISDKTPQN